MNQLSAIGRILFNTTFVKDKAKELDILDSVLSGAHQRIIRLGYTMEPNEDISTPAGGCAAFIIGGGTALSIREYSGIISLKGTEIIAGEGTAFITSTVGSDATISVAAYSDTQASTQESQQFDLDEIRSTFYSIGEDDDFIHRREHGEIIAKYLDYRPSWLRELIFNPQSSIACSFRTLVFIGESLRSRLYTAALDILCLALSHRAPYLRHGSIMAYLTWDNPAILKILSEHRKSEASAALCRLIDRALESRSA